MCCKGFFRRFVPFFLTFAVGLFIASFFVTIAAPSFQFKRNFNSHRQYHRMMEMENQRLREENVRLKQKLSSPNVISADEFDLNVPPPPPLPPFPVHTVPYKDR